MPPKKSRLSKKPKYWYLSKETTQVHEENNCIAVDSQTNTVESGVNTEMVPISESSVNTDVISMCDSSINTEPVEIKEVPLNKVPHVPTRYESLRQDISVQNSFSPFLLNTNSELIQLVEFYSDDIRQNVKWCVTITRAFEAKIVIHNVEVSKEHEIWLGIPTVYHSLGDILKLLRKLSSYSVCSGNPDEEFQELVPIGAGLSDNKSPGIIAYREGNFSAQKGDLNYSSSIRSVFCIFLVAGNRCHHCSKYRENLRKRKHRIEEKKSLPTPDFLKSNHSHSNMDRETLIVKLKQQRTEIKSLMVENFKMRQQFEQEVKRKGILLNENESRDMGDLMKLCQDDVMSAYPDSNCLQRLFWDQQIKSSKENAHRSMRWHPMIIRWCLFMRHKSAKAYDAMRESGFINLPSSRTLFDYSHYTKSALGLQPDVLKMLKTECEKLEMFSEHWKSHVGLLFDEIKIKSDLVYDKHTGELIGYVDLDKVGNEILELERLSREDNSSTVAKCVLVLMVRGCTSNLRFPLAAYATTSITADLLYPIVWRAIHHLEAFVKLKVLFCTCDGAAANRKFFNLHQINNDQALVYFTKNPHDENRNIYFISDAPHLLKTARNCFSNSFSHRNTRKLWKDGRDISWLHIVNLFEDHCEMGIYNPCPRLTRNHICLNPYSCMKVNLAAQVFSESVACALEMLYGDCVLETVKFIRLFNKFFDCLNVRSLYEGRQKRNTDLNPYDDVNDPRLQWLETEFLGYFSQWFTSIQNRRGQFAKSDVANMQLSHQTLTGLKMTVKSVVACVKHLLNEGASFVFTHAFNQDPLEQHFSHYRNKGGQNSNPTVYEVRNALTQIRAVGAQAIVPRQGNIQRHVRDGDVNQIDNTPLPRRQSLSK